jgi:hypothetical protein
VVGDATIDLSSVRKATRFTLAVSLHDQDEVVTTNDWSFWVFPEVPEEWRRLSADASERRVGEQDIFIRLGPSSSSAVPDDASLILADAVDETLADYIEAGGRCLLMVKNAAIENRNVYYGTTTFYNVFRTIPWNAGTSGNSGTVITPHPSLLAFPHDDMCDLQFVWLFRDALPMEYEPLRSYGVEPIIRLIDHYAANRNNAHLLEFKVGKGRVLATTLNILPNVDKRIEARYLLRCLTEYVAGQEFAPKASVPRAEFLRWFTPHGKTGDN